MRRTPKLGHSKKQNIKVKEYLNDETYKILNFNIPNTLNRKQCKNHDILKRTSQEMLSTVLGGPGEGYRNRNHDILGCMQPQVICSTPTGSCSHAGTP